MKYYRYLYVDENIKDIDKVKQKLNLHRELIGLYLICLSKDNDELFIMSSYFLKLKYYRKNPVIIVGIMKSYDACVDTIIAMTEDSVKRTGEADLKKYLIKRTKSDDFKREIL